MVGYNIKRRIAYISSFLPRKCGIATFTSDLIKGVAATAGKNLEPVVIAMQSKWGHRYREPVRCVVRQNNRRDYIRAAEYINSSDVDVVSLQHEFGLFGGEGGAYISLLLDRLKADVITTLHTVLERPSTEYFNSLVDVCKASRKVIVMNRRGIRMLREIYGVPGSKIELIAHGIHDIPFVESSRGKEKLGMAGRKTILTFGLIGRNKGIEVMLKAMRTIVKRHPSALYIVLGAMHPEVVRHEGYAYKDELERMVNRFGLKEHVVFHDRFVVDDELHDFLRAADVYATPYLHKEQLTSGTLAFAVGAGKAVVSTPYWAAEELLSWGRGKLVPFGDSERMAEMVSEIFSNSLLFNTLRWRAYEYGRDMTWSRTSLRYWNLFNSVSSATVPAEAHFMSEPWMIPAVAGRRIVNESA